MSWTFQSSAFSASFVTPATTASFILVRAADRRGLTLYNNTSAAFYLLPSGSTSPAPDLNKFMVKLSPGAYYELPQPFATAPMWGLFDTVGSGSLNVVEFGSG